MDIIWQLILAASIPSAIASGAISLLFRRKEKRDDERRAFERAEAERREKDRRELSLLVIKGTMASMALGEATATALKNGHCNGETERALAYEQSVKHDIRNFLAENGIEHTT